MQEIKIPVINQSKWPLPEYATTGSSGLDLKANIDEEIELLSLERKLIPTGIFAAIPLGFEAQVRPRSGMAIKQGLTCLNSPGTIDSDYRGEIKVILVNLGTEIQTIQPGDRIAQLVFQPVTRILWQEEADLDATSRNAGGFGHSGK